MNRISRFYRISAPAPAREMDEADSDELVLIQGIIDAWFEDGDGAVLCLLYTSDAADE